MMMPISLWLIISSPALVAVLNVTEGKSAWRGCYLLWLFHAIWKPRAVCRLHRAVCRLRGHRFNELHARVCFGEITSKKTENCHDFIVLYCVRNWERISVVENLVRHNNRSFRANKLVIVSPNYKQENE